MAELHVLRCSDCNVVLGYSHTEVQADGPVLCYYCAHDFFEAAEIVGAQQFPPAHAIDTMPHGCTLQDGERGAVRMAYIEHHGFPVNVPPPPSDDPPPKRKTRRRKKAAQQLSFDVDGALDDIF